MLRAGLRSVVPILPAEAGLRQSGSVRLAFGAVAVTLPENPGSLSALLLHEMQHVIAELVDQIGAEHPDIAAIRAHLRLSRVSPQPF